MAIGLETLDHLGSSTGQSAATFWVSTAMAQRSQASVFKPPLVTAHCAHRATESPGDLDLISPSLFNQIDHGVGLGHVVRQRILRLNDSRDDHHRVVILRSDETPLVNRTDALWVPNIGK
jgi:hypothetical protein